jgi:predicted nucleotidyltransferase
MTRARINIPQTRVATFCHRHHIRKLALFGSVLRDDFRPDSDIDVLVEFEAGHVPGFIRLAGMELELVEIFGGHRVEMHTPMCLSPYFRDEAMAESELLYVQA